MSEEFIFRTSLKLQELTGHKAATLDELLKGIREADESVIFNHTHHFVFQHQYWISPPSNDFAHWVGEVLQEQALGERLGGLNIMEFSSLHALQEALIQRIQEAGPEVDPRRRVPSGMEFHFIRAHSLILATPYRARTLQDFYEALRHVSPSSIYYHIFEARLRLKQPTNDFSRWLGDQQESALAGQINRLDPYSYSLDGLREALLTLLEKMNYFVPPASGR